jgi:anthranilate synthase component I
MEGGDPRWGGQFCARSLTGENSKGYEWLRWLFTVQISCKSTFQFPQGQIPDKYFTSRLTSRLVRRQFVYYFICCKGTITMITPTFEDFQELAKQGNLVPVSRELIADMDTPVSLFKRLDADSDYAFLLESVEQGEKLGRFSFLGIDPEIVLTVHGGQQELVMSGEKITPKETPVETLRYLLSRYKPVPVPGMPPFIGGAVGYMSYDTVRYFENIPDTCEDDFHLPDCFVMIAESLIAFDHVKHRLILVVNARVEEGCNLKKVYTSAVMKLNFLQSRLYESQSLQNTQEDLQKKEMLRKGADETRNYFDAVIQQQREAREKKLGTFGVDMEVVSNTTQAEYEQMVLNAKEYIAAGDIFQVVLSQRFSTDLKCHPFDIYRSLRAVNPSPYMFYLKCGDELQIAGSSPEVLSKLQEGKVTVRPIAGTRPRGSNPSEDIDFEKDLLADDKECAEHVMLVDLGRNDVGRVCKFGTVTVDDFMVIERYSHVMHIVSNVSGMITDDKDAFDVLGATFPAGTLSGAPKIRAMEIIDELEKNRRGPYGGSVVYFSYDGSMDSCITIRTAVITGGKVHVQAGAGVVADSVPEREYMECVNKAKGMLKAVELAHQGLE